MDSALFANLPLPLLLIDFEQMHILDANPAFRNLFGAKIQKGTALTNIFSGLEIKAVLEAQKQQLDKARHPKQKSLIMRGRANNLYPLPVGIILLEFEHSTNRATLAVLSTQPDEPILEQSFFNFIWDFCPDLIFIKDNDGKYISGNKAFKKAMGNFGNKTKNKQPFQNLESRTKDAFKDIDDKVFSQNRAIRRKGMAEYPALGKIFVDTVRAPIKGPQGQPLGLVGIARNIESEQKKLQQMREMKRMLAAANKATLALLIDVHKFNRNLRKALKHITTAANASHAFVWCNHLDSNGLLFSSQISEYFQPTAIRPKTSQSTNLAFASIPHCHKLLSSGKCVNTLVKNLPPSDREYFESQNIISILAVPIFLNKHFWGVIGFDDCSQERAWTKTEENIMFTVGPVIASADQHIKTYSERQKSEAAFRDIVYASSEVVWEVDAKTFNIRFISNRALDILQQDPDKITGTPVTTIFPDKEAFEHFFKQEVIPQINKHKSFANLLHKVKKITGEELWVKSSGVGLFDDKGNLIAIRGASLNINDEMLAKHDLESSLAALKQANTEIEQYVETVQSLAYEANSASRAKSEFLANISHEVRTPINIITGMTYLALQESSTPKQKEYLNKISDAGNSLLSILTDIIEFANQGDGGFVFEKSEIDLKKIIQSIISDIKKHRSIKNIKLSLYFSSDIPQKMIGDKARISQIFKHLLDNAVKFTPKGQVDVKCLFMGKDDKGILLQIVISDTGIGMPKEAYENVFEAFVQLEADNTRRFGGAGIGLPMVKRLITAMGGKIWIESKIGAGTQVFFTLPLEPLTQDKHKPNDEPDKTTAHNEMMSDDCIINCLSEEDLHKLLYLRELLENDDAKALEISKELDYTIRKTDQNIADELAKAISIFDFFSAIEIIDQLKQKYSSTMQ